MVRGFSTQEERRRGAQRRAKDEEVEVPAAVGILAVWRCMCLERGRRGGDLQRLHATM